jgi:hypothetical protein
MRVLSGSYPASRDRLFRAPRFQRAAVVARLARLATVATVVLVTSAALFSPAVVATGLPASGAAVTTGIGAAAAWAADADAGSPRLSPRALAAALEAAAGARERGVAARQDLLTVIDYSLPSTAPRLWVLDLARHKVLFNELVAHGAGSGDNFATRFSNDLDSRQTSLGLFVTAGTYEGGNGYSLRLRGLQPGVNDRAEERNIVIHGAWYVSAEHASRYGRLGRSWGCPALPQEVAASVIDTIKEGSFVFAYAPESSPLAHSGTAARR